jgi:hypothetical protein
MAAAERAAPAATGRDPRKSNSNRIGSENNAAPRVKQPGTAKASKKDLPRGDDGNPAYSRQQLLNFNAAFSNAMAKAIESGSERHRGRR